MTAAHDRPLVWLEGEIKLDLDAVVITGVVRKTTRRTLKRVITECRRRLRQYDVACGGEA